MGTPEMRNRIFWENAHEKREKLEEEAREFEKILFNGVQHLQMLSVNSSERAALIDKMLAAVGNLAEKQAILDFTRSC